MNDSVKKNDDSLFDNFLLTQHEQFRPCLAAMHQLIRSVVPDAEETLSYQVHCFKHIYMLVGIGSTKQYCSLYTMSSKLVKQMKEELTGCKISGTALHFKPDEQLPEKLITHVVLARIQENEAIAIARKKKK